MIRMQITLCEDDSAPAWAVVERIGEHYYCADCYIPTSEALYDALMDFAKQVQDARHAANH